MLLGLAACDGDDFTNRTDSVASIEVSTKDGESGATEDVITIDSAEASGAAVAATPMAQRTAVIGLLNKRNGVSRDLTMKPGQAVRVGDAIVRLRACERTAPWEPDAYTGAFVQLDVRQTDDTWRRAFSGWLYKERPSLNVVQHPIYDVWPKSCAMTFADKGPSTTSVGEGATDPSRRSSAPKSAASAPAAATAVPSNGPSEALSNAR